MFKGIPKGTIRVPLKGSLLRSLRALETLGVSGLELQVLRAWFQV